MRFFVPLFFIVLFLAWSCQPDANPSGGEDLAEGELPPIAEDYEEARYKWGFMDQQGRLAIEPRFDEVRAFPRAWR